MTYTVAVAFALAGALLLDLAVLRTRLVAGLTWWLTYPIVLGFQLLANGILTGRGVVRYDPHAIIGWRVVHAPVEDLVFGFALVLVTLSIWTWLGRRGIDEPAPDGSMAGVRVRDLGELRPVPVDESRSGATSTPADR